MPFPLCLSDIYDCRVAWRLWGEGKGWPGVSPEHPMKPQRWNRGQVFLTTRIQRARPSQPFPSNWEVPKLMKKKTDKSQKAQTGLRKQGGPRPGRPTFGESEQLG